MVHRDSRGGTLMIDRKFRGVGRIKKASGTTDKGTLKDINSALTHVFRVMGRIDLLRALKADDFSPLEFLTAYKTNTLDALPVGGMGASLDAAWRDWMDGLVVPDDCSQKHKDSLETSRRYLERENGKALVVELPPMLAALRVTLGKKHRRSFNLLRDACRAFVRDVYQTNSPLYGAVVAVEPVKVRKQRAERRLSPDEMRSLFPHPDSDHVDAIAWTMATTGMHRAELWGKWNVKADRIHVRGTKREGRVRDVPLVRRPDVPRIHPRTFEDKVRERTRDIVVYDLRGTFAHWMEEAGIPRTRRKLYMGHGAEDTTDLYERHEVTAFLAADAKKLRDYIGLPEPAKLAVVKENA